MRVCIFAHFDRDDRVDPYVLKYLAELRTVCQQVIFVSTSKLGETEQAKLTGLAERIILKPNVGYDFASWQSGLAAVQLEHCTELVICNDSCYGPLAPLTSVFERMARRMTSEPCDFWGMTSNNQGHWHLQSYFMVFRRAVIQSEAFANFWKEVGPRPTKIDVINDFEIGLSTKLMAAGFHPATVFQWRFMSRIMFATHYMRALAIHFIFYLWVLTFPQSYKAKKLRADGYYFMRIKQLHQVNLLHHLWREVLASGVPFVKIELLRDNPLRAKTGGALEFINSLSPEMAAAAKNHLSRLTSGIESPAEHVKF